jgi:hypothetical protein
MISRPTAVPLFLSLLAWFCGCGAQRCASREEHAVKQRCLPYWHQQGCTDNAGFSSIAIPISVSAMYCQKQRSESLVVLFDMLGGGLAPRDRLLSAR